MTRRDPCAVADFGRCTLLREVKPTYTVAALRAKIQGSVVLEVVGQCDGTRRDIRVIRSLY